MSELIFEKVNYRQYLDQALGGQAPQGSRAQSVGRGTRRSDNRADFTGTDTWTEAVDLVRDGWKEGRELVGQILTRIESRFTPVAKRKVRKSVCGSAVNVGRYVQGVPESMLRWEKRSVNRRNARILLNLSASGAVSAETLRWRGACVLALVDRLESEGIRAEVDLGFCNEQDGQYWTICANVKRTDEPLHIDRLAFLLVNPASLRRVMWSYCEASASKGKDGEFCSDKHHFNKLGWYGMPVSDIRLPQGEKYDLVVSGLQLRTIEQALASIETMFNQVAKGAEELR